MARMRCIEQREVVSMFADPFTAIMALVVLSFAGTLVLFVFLLRSLDALRRSVHETRGNLQMRLSDTEHQLNDLVAAVRKLASAKGGAPAPERGSSADLGEMLEKGLCNLGRQDGFDLPDLSLSDVAADKAPAGGKSGGSGPLDIL